ncbi:MAG: hypothetical protein HQL46_00220 [Gammaproteobacteria bacterium]|nr:hypothetical protein [Gammaproteobacteria bacterium]
MLKPIYVILIIMPFLFGCRGTNDTVQETKQAANSSKNFSSSATIKLSDNIPFKKGVRVRPAIKTDCDLGGKLSEYVQSFGQSKNFNFSPTKGKRELVLNISHVHGTGGGAWTGAKSVTVEGKLMEGSKLIGSFTGTRTSGGGFFGAYKGTCSILGRCVKTLGKDIATWLETPTKNAIIGE